MMTGQPVEPNQPVEPKTFWEEALAARRLYDLLIKISRADTDLALLQRRLLISEKPARQKRLVLLVGACVAIEARRGTSQEEIQTTLQSNGAVTQRVYQIGKRMGRASTLIDRLLFSGIVRRGEHDRFQPCPHCGNANEPGDGRCFACERLIG